MQARNGQRCLSHIGAGNFGTACCHAFTQNSAAAAYIKYALSGKRAAGVDKVEPERIDVVQGLEFTLLVPPARRQFFELSDLDWINVGFYIAHGVILR
jgi:hypothetical protein